MLRLRLIEMLKVCQCLAKCARCSVHVQRDKWGKQEDKKDGGGL